MATMQRNKSDFFVMKQKPIRPRIRPPSYITLSDFMRIQNEINPVNSEYENRKALNAKLKMLSQTKSKNWPDSIEMRKKNQFEIAKKRFLEEEERRRLIDIEEKKYYDAQNNLIIQKAQKLLFDEQDPVKTFNMKLMYCDMLKERDYQNEIKNRKKEINNIIEKQFLEMDKKNRENYDKKEIKKAEIEEEKKKFRMKVINDQLRQSKIKIIQDYQEKLVEGELMKLNMKKALEEEKKEKELIEQKKKEQRKQYIEANKRLQQYKEELKKKEVEEDKKIQEFAFKKQQLEDLKKKIEAEKEKEKQKQRDKLEAAQMAYYNSLKKNENEILERSLKEAEDRNAAEARREKEKRDKMMNDIKEQIKADKERKEAERIKNKEEDMQYIDDYKRKLKVMEDAEKEEWRQRRQRNKDLADYQKLQYEEKKRLAVDDFKQFNEDSYKNLRRLEIEDNDFIKYAEYWIKEYKQQGKNITPLLLELKRYKKNYSLK